MFNLRKCTSILFTYLLVFPSNAMANPACAVCTIAIGASLGIARKLGVEDSIVGLWAGALLALIGYWTILLFDKKNWHFKGRNFLIMLLSLGMIGFIYIKEVTYKAETIWKIFHIDQILFSSILGMLVFIASQKAYEWMKAKNNNKAHFPFEKVVLPLFLLIIASVLLSFFPLVKSFY